MNTHLRRPHATRTPARIGARDLDAELGAMDLGAEVSATSASTLDHMDRPPYNVGAKMCGAEMCYLGAMIHDAELRVYFLKSFQNGCICEILLPKGSKKQKSRGE
jgi:hypothetical protein